MFNHIGVKVKDLDASARFYSAALGALGYQQGYSDETVVSLGPKDAPGLWLGGDAKLAHSLVHMAFTAGSHAAVDAFYREGLRAGGRDNGAPGAAQGLQPDVLRGVSPGSRRQQCRGGVPEMTASVT
jgi:catechol 2,3-dioxygenase-like lactoylglutathione lyase family enzyme